MVETRARPYTVESTATRVLRPALQARVAGRYEHVGERPGGLCHQQQHTALLVQRIAVVAVGVLGHVPHPAGAVARRLAHVADLLEPEVALDERLLCAAERCDVPLGR